MANSRELMWGRCGGGADHWAVKYCWVEWLTAAPPEELASVSMCVVEEGGAKARSG
jgi:hypothetical protein